MDTSGKIKFIVVVALQLRTLTDDDLALRGTIWPQHDTVVLRVSYPKIATNIHIEALGICQLAQTTPLMPIAAACHGR
jgi:hypothetical protein